MEAEMLVIALSTGYKKLIHYYFDKLSKNVFL